MKLGRLVPVWVGALALLIVTWQMLAYRDRWHAITDNDRWEAHLKEAHALDARRIVFFGDSELGYWPIAESFGSLPIIDRGKYADFALTAHERFERDAIEFNPKVLVLLFGENDLEHQQPAQEIIANLDRLIERAQAKGITVVLCGLLPASGPWLKYHSALVIQGVNARLRALALRRGIEFVDFFPTLADAEGTFPVALTREGLHPNRLGYARMTNQLLPILLRDLIN
jgi:hypothetical protein